MIGSLYRHELKFYISEITMRQMILDLRTVMPSDKHSGYNGGYLIRSIYFDDYSDKAYWENESGTDPRYKYRIRAYNINNSKISLEKKIKINGFTRKESTDINIAQFCDIMQNHNICDNISEDGLLNEFLLSMNVDWLHPTVIVEYQRIPFVYDLGNVRITFDTQIAASRDYNSFFDRSMRKIHVLPSPYHILEVKYDDFLPKHIHKVLSRYGLIQTTFSKYFISRNALLGRLVASQEVLL